MFTKRIVATLLLILLSGTPLVAVEFFVSPTGNDANPGTRSRPLASLVGARNAIRKLKGQGRGAEPIRVTVESGHYAMTEPFQLTPEDSGSMKYPVVYQGADGAMPLFSGGRKIHGWQPVANGLFATRIPDVEEGKWYFEQLFVNGRRATRARTPNQFYFYIQDVKEQPLETDSKPEAGQFQQTVRMRDVDFQTIAKLRPGELRDVHFVVYHKWDNTRRFIERLDRDQKALVTVGKAMKSWNPWKRQSRYHLENFRGALDSPGEWFLDRDGTLYYWPLPGEDMEHAAVIAPVAERLIEIQGDPTEGKFVQHVTIRHLAFHHARWLTPPGGFEAAQAAAPITASVMLDGAKNVTIEDCEFGHVGTYAVWFRQGCRSCTLRHCHLVDFGAGGVRIGETVIRENPAQRTSHIVVDNNIVRHGGRIFPCAVGAWIGQSGDNTITHNEIADLFYTGISVGWRWGYAESLAKRNTIAHNHVHHVGQGVLSDMGGIYTLGPSEGTVVRNNVFHDVYAYSYGGWGLYTDEGSTGILFENNLVYNVKTGGFHQHYGKENIVRNNILAFSKLYQLQATRVEDHLSFTFEKNIVYYDEGVLLSGPWNRVRHVSRNNCFWKTGDGTVEFLGKPLADWQAAGHEQHSVVADPKFANPKEFDFHLASDSPALEQGFKPFNWKQAGVQGDRAWIEKARDTPIAPLKPTPEPPR